MTEYVSASDNEIAEALDPFFQELRAKVGVPFAAHLIGGINEMVDCRIRSEREKAGWQPIETAPKDGTRILASLYREASVDMDGFKMKAFREVREIWYQPYQIMGMQMPWHAGDPYDSHDGMAPEHMGEAVPTHWQPLPTPPALLNNGKPV